MEEIVIVSTFNAVLLDRPLEFWADKLGMRWHTHYLATEELERELANPAALFWSDQPGFNVVLFHESDLGKMVTGRDERTACSLGCVEGLKEWFKSVVRPTVIFITPNSIDEKGTNGSVIDRSSGIGNLYIFNNVDIQSIYPVREIFGNDSGNDLGIPYSQSYFNALATEFARVVCSIRFPPVKVIVLDADNTLWKGICGEDGPQGVELDGPALGIQEFAKKQISLGRLLCICSKNNERDVVEVFENRPDFPLSREDFVAIRANWERKSENLKNLAIDLNLDLSSFVFIDDSPVECKEVCVYCPEVFVIPLPEQRDVHVEKVSSVWAFDNFAPSVEDESRTRQYRTEVGRQNERKRAGSFAEFLRDLDIRVTVSSLEVEEIPRVIQLSRRTNQFNTTTIRLDEAKLAGLIDEREVHVVRVIDRYGDYGLVGFVACCEDGDEANLELFFLSCRVLGRGVEHQVLVKIASCLLDRGIEFVNIAYKPSERNTVMRMFLESIPENLHSDSGGFRFATKSLRELYFEPKEFSPSDSNDEIVKRDAPTILTVSKNRNDLLRRISHDWNTVEKIDQAVEDFFAIDSFEMPNGFSEWRKSQRVKALKNDLRTMLVEAFPLALSVARENESESGFFELGMSSLDLVELAMLCRRRYGIMIPLTVAFDFPNLDALTAWIDCEIGNSNKRDEIAENSTKDSSIEQSNQDIANLSEAEVLRRLID